MFLNRKSVAYPEKRHKGAMVRKSTTDLNLKQSSRLFSKLTLKFLGVSHPLMILAPTDCKTMTSPPHWLRVPLINTLAWNHTAKGILANVNSWLFLFKAKETLEGVVVMPRQLWIIQHRACDPNLPRAQEERELESFWRFVDKLNKTKTHKKSPSSSSTGFFFMWLLEPNHESCDHERSPLRWRQTQCLSLSNLGFLLCENKCCYLSHFP